VNFDRGVNFINICTPLFLILEADFPPVDLRHFFENGVERKVQKLAHKYHTIDIPTGAVYDHNWLVKLNGIFCAKLCALAKLTPDLDIPLPQQKTQTIFLKSCLFE